MLGLIITLCVPCSSDVSDQGLEGTVHAWELPSTLTNLDLGNNRLTGSLPSSWNLPSGLDSIFLSGNNLEGAHSFNPLYQIMHGGLSSTSHRSGRPHTNRGGNGIPGLLVKCRDSAHLAR